MSKTLCRIAFTAIAAAALTFTGSTAAMADDPQGWPGNGSTFFKTSTTHAGPTGATSTYTVSYAN
ncbi:hypothetical protein HS041_37485 [Planomonospora sp. ID67723]|uniref:hypothetical protein n=1 Tax=Planomonospora sp. ID67723 TaxID=2738134 RepID=UPI0018C39048|nr:hypothetical protein [Planomonospora sp. ID67723]MBG0833396.1 hypothetical protein [Planomonospora sp. ID67723]